MLKSDFNAKMIEIFNAALVQINKCKDEEKYDEALKIIDKTLKELFRLNLKSFNTLKSDNLLELIKTKDTIESDKCIMIAKFLQEEAQIIQIREGFDESYYLYLKALTIYLNGYASGDVAELHDYFKEIDNIHNYLMDYKLPYDISYMLLGYYEDTKNYTAVEDLIFDNIEDNEDIRKLGIVFYEKLLSSNESDIELGGLTRDEVIQSLNELK